MVSTEDRLDSGDLRRAALTIALTLLAVAAALWLLFRVRTLVFMIFVSLFVAVALEPPVQYLTKRGWRRGVATGVVFAVGFLLVVSFFAALIPLMVSQVSALIESIPGYLDSLSALISRWLDVDLGTFEFGDQFDDVAQWIQDNFSSVFGGVVGIGSTVFSAIFQVVTIGLFSFYIVADFPKLRRSLLTAFPAEVQREALRIWEIAVEKMGGYIYSRLIMAVVSGSLTILALWIIGVPFAVPLGIWVGVLSQFIPVVGTYLAAVMPVLVALGESPGQALWVAVFLVAYQQLENFLIGPRITQRTMAIHPAISIGAIIVGGAVLGAVGIVLSLPVAAIVSAVVATTIERHDEVGEIEPLAGDAAATAPD